VDIDCFQVLDFLIEQGGERVFELNSCLVEDLSVLHFQVSHLIVHIVDVYQAWRLTGQKHRSHEHVNQTGKAFDVLFACVVDLCSCCHFKVSDVVVFLQDFTDLLVSCNYTFFKESLLACFIFGLVFWLLLSCSLA
jgi:hypothetical protein